jgi:lipoprotein-anchoring transpeptidase ErfK/SrfK
MPLDDEALPGVDQTYPQEASIDPDQQPAAPLHQQKPIITVTKKPQAEITALQVFLDREGISPGVIDGHLGDNVNKALAAWQEMTGETIDPNNSEDIMQRLTYSGGLPIVDYTITAADAAGPYVAAIPEDYAHKAQLPAMSYTSVTEKLAEQFHMDEGYLKALNPNADFSIPGTTIKVVNPGPMKTGQVARIVADKGRKQVFAYGADGKLIAAYPATIGSSDTPSPTGTHTVERIAFDPGYTYNPKINFKQGDNDQILQIPPGPNGPVGSIWIALSKPTYGIHGTPDPSKIGKTNSHGCVRLTNWDATELAKMVKPGTVVEFTE